MRILKALAPLVLYIESGVWHFIWYYLLVGVFFYCFGLDCFWTLDTIVILFSLWSQCPHHLEAIWSINNANWLVGFWVICSIYSVYLFICLIFYLFVLFAFYVIYICFCLLILLILLFVVVFTYSSFQLISL